MAKAFDQQARSNPETNASLDRQEIAEVVRDNKNNKLKNIGAGYRAVVLRFKEIIKLRSRGNSGRYIGRDWGQFVYQEDDSKKSPDSTEGNYYEVYVKPMWFDGLPDPKSVDPKHYLDFAKLYPIARTKAGSPKVSIDLQAGDVIFVTPESGDKPLENLLFEPIIVDHLSEYADAASAATSGKRKKSNNKTSSSNRSGGSNTLGNISGNNNRPAFNAQRLNSGISLYKQLFINNQPPYSQKSNNKYIKLLNETFGNMVKAFIALAWTELEAKIKINSGARSPKKQKEMRKKWDAWVNGGKVGKAPYAGRPAKAPEKNSSGVWSGGSYHNVALAIDFNPTLKDGTTLYKITPADDAVNKVGWENSGLIQIGTSLGMTWGGDFGGNYDPVHFDYRPYPAAKILNAGESQNINVNDEPHLINLKKIT